MRTRRPKILVRFSGFDRVPVSQAVTPRPTRSCFLPIGALLTKGDCAGSGAQSLAPTAMRRDGALSLVEDVGDLSLPRLEFREFAPDVTLDPPE